MDVPDLYQFLTKEIRSAQFDPDAIVIDDGKQEKAKMAASRPVS